MNEFMQLCVLDGVIMGDTTPEEFEKSFLDQGFRVKFAEEVVTLPDAGIEGTGGRHDILFYIHTDDISKFAVARLQMGIRWWEDVVKYNNHSNWYTQEILDKYPIRW